MDLLTSEHRASLLAVLYGLLMIMPQTDAFHMLHRRLQCVPVNLTLPPAAAGHKDEKKEKKK
jgi:vacuole morphology and inheritance protein 14